jgi:hypothetical protein
MDQQSWKFAENYINEISEKLDEILNSPELEGLRLQLSELGKNLGDRYGVSLTCVLDIVDLEKEQTLPLQSTGLSHDQHGDVYRTWNAASFQQYIVDGNICVVPHDYCPSCWGEWVYKWENPSCPECGITLGDTCKILVDSDVCPHCEKGTISMNDSTCDRCGFKIDPSIVVWG